MNIESAIIKFTILGRTHAFDFRAAHYYTQGLLETATKASLVFTDIVACRFKLKIEEDGDFVYEHAMQTIKTLDADSFLKILNFPVGISNDDWVSYLKQVQRKFERLAV